MPTTSLQTTPLPFASAARMSAAGWAAGLAFTFALFFGLAQIEKVAGGVREPEIADLPVVTLPLETPPAPPRNEPPPPDDAPPPLTGIEASATDSPVKMVVMPPDLAALMPEDRIPPRATVSLSQLAIDLRPRVSLESDARHVYQQSEVDRLPMAVVRVAPPAAASSLEGVGSLAVNLLLLIDLDGRAENVRVIRSSGKPEFDAVVAATVKDDWVFSPAVRRGKKVRCLVEQSVRVKMGGGGSPFED